MTTNLTDAVLDLAIQTQALQIECALARDRIGSRCSIASRPPPCRSPSGAPTTGDPMRASAERDLHILARIFGAAGVELRRDADGVSHVAWRANRRGTRLQQAILWQAAAGHQVVRRVA